MFKLNVHPIYVYNRNGQTKEWEPMCLWFWFSHRCAHTHTHKSKCMLEDRWEFNVSKFWSRIEKRRELAIDRFQRSKLKRDFFVHAWIPMDLNHLRSMRIVCVAFWLHFIGLSLFSTSLRTILIIIWWQVIVSHIHKRIRTCTERCLLWYSFLLLLFFRLNPISHWSMKLSAGRENKNRIIHMCWSIIHVFAAVVVIPVM